MRKLKLAFIVVAVLALCVSCGTMNVHVTPEGSLAGMYKIYNDQYDDYQKMAKDPNTTEAQKEVMRKKKPILDKLGKLLPVYDSGLISGEATDKQREQITDLLNELGRL